MSRANKLNPIAYWFMCHIRAFFFGIGELLRTPFASLMTLVVIGIAMALPSGLFVMLKNFENINQHWQGTPTVSLYLKQNTSEQQLKLLMQELKRIPSVASLGYISPQEGLQQFTQVTSFGKSLAQLKENPLPGVIVVTPNTNNTSPAALRNLLNYLQNLPRVELGQLDMAWIKRLYYIITIGKRFVYALALLFGIGVILIIGNTIRLTTQSHQREINVLKLVGATHAFIRRPLLYRGLMYGLFGGAIAWGLVSLVLWWLAEPAKLLASTYNNDLFIQGLSANVGFSIIGICALLGLIGSWFAVREHLLAPEES